MTEHLCPACGGEGIIDEMQAGNLRVDLGDARTGWCPVCEGSGQAPGDGLTWAIVRRLAPLAIACWAVLIGIGYGLFRLIFS